MGGLANILDYLIFCFILVLYTFIIMASNLTSPTDEATLITDFNNPDAISRCLREHLQGAPLAWMMIHGSHSITSQQTSPPEQVVDFALKIKGMNAQLLGVEVGSIEDNSKVFSMDRSAHNSAMLDEEIIQKCCQAVIELPNRGSYQGYADHSRPKMYIY
jgi:hypothetical protein